jgi:hypothetical protein
MAYVAESTYGTTPGTPTLTPIRHNSTNLGLSKDTLSSEELRSDRMITDFRHGPYQIGGDVAFELSYGSFDDLLEATLGGTWATASNSGWDEVKGGTTRRSFTVRRYFSDLDSGNKYHVFTGVEMNSMQMTMTPGAIVTGTLGTIGQNLVTQASEISGASVSASPTAEAMTAIEGQILEGGSAIGVATEISLDIQNGMEARHVIGSKQTLEPSIGRSNVSGSMTAYFEDGSLLNKFINETNSSIDVFLEDTSGNQIRIYLPNVVYTSGQPDVEGEGPISLSMSFQAVYDSTEDSNIVIQRNPIE